MNSILYRLVGVANLTDVRLHYKSCDDPDGDFFPIDRKSKIFNKSKQLILKSGFINSVQGRVVLSVKDFRVNDDCHFFLLIYVSQDLVEIEGDILPETVNECLFK